MSLLLGDKVEYCGDSQFDEGDGTVIYIKGKTIGVLWSSGKHTEDNEEDLRNLRLLPRLKKKKTFKIKVGDRVTYVGRSANLPQNIGTIQWVVNEQVGVKWDDGLQCSESYFDLKLIPKKTIIKLKIKKRSLQELYNESREVDEIIAKAKQRKKELLEAIKSNKINLINEKKIEWVEMPFEKWLMNEAGSGESEFHIYESDKGKTTGVWKGYDTLSKSELEHFEEYVYDYHYYSAPYYVDRFALENYETCSKSFELIRLVRTADGFNKR